MCASALVCPMATSHEPDCGWIPAQEGEDEFETGALDHDAFRGVVTVFGLGRS